MGTVKSKNWHNTKIEIGGIIYTVKYMARRKPSKKKYAPRITAILDTATRTLWVRRDMSPSEIIQSIVHEIMHGINDALFPASLLGKYHRLEELLVEPYSRMLCSALRSAGLLNE